MRVRRVTLGGALLALAACRGDDETATPATPRLVLEAPAPAAAPAPAGATHAAPDAREGAIRARYTKYEYRVPVRDGARLFTAVYVPNDASEKRRYPLLMARTPYSVGPYGAGRYPAALGANAAYEKEGFIFVFQDVRGAYMSEGQFVNVRPHRPGKRAPAEVDESSDTHDTIAWLLKNVPFHNGRVGLWGISYPGFYASAGAIDSHPALKAVSPQAPIADWWRGDDMHRHGAFNLQLAFGFFSGFGRPRPKPTDARAWKPFEYGTPDAYQFYLDLGSAAEAEAKHFKGDVAFWKDLVAHPDYDAFWKERNLLPHLRNVKAAVLVVGGWFDTEDLYGPLATYRAIEAQNQGAKNAIVMGPWRHGGWRRTTGERLGDADFGFPTSETFQAMELAFFTHHLKGGDDPGLAEATMFETGANRWRRFDAWPPPRAREGRLYLRENEALSFDAATPEGQGFDEFVSDPARPVPYTQEIAPRWSADYMAEDQRFASRRPDVLVYATPPLERDVTLAGPLEAELYVSTSATDADWVVKLVDVNPGTTPGSTANDEDEGKKNRGGQQTLVRGEPFRGRYRDGYEAPKPFVPGEVTKVKFAINDVFHTFQRGHRIMVQVQSSWFPFVDRNPQTYVPSIYEATRSDYVKATHRVYRSKATPSLLRVRLLPPPDE
ncbi:MAG TPA: CocE/NonD family hydrolase [Polyangiaceae bacterium]|nr:CocE/NonD family hydrolase [Polyangiaceae bacterium]